MFSRFGAGELALGAGPALVFPAAAGRSAAPGSDERYSTLASDSLEHPSAAASRRWPVVDLSSRSSSGLSSTSSVGDDGFGCWLDWLKAMIGSEPLGFDRASPMLCSARPLLLGLCCRRGRTTGLGFASFDPTTGRSIPQLEPSPGLKTPRHNTSCL